MRSGQTWWKKLGGEQIDPWLRVEAPEQIGAVDGTALFLLVVTCIWYFTAYLSSDSVPSNVVDGPPAWWGWHDQGEYYKSTIDLAHGQLKPANYWFGYPILGVPFYWLMPRHPYFIPNIIMVLVFVGSFFAVCRHFVSRIEAWILVIYAIFAESLLRDTCLVVPWNTLPTYATIYLSTYLLLVKPRPALWQFGLCAAASGEAIFARPTEIIPLAVIYIFALLGMEGGRRLWAMAFFGVACAAAALITVSINLCLYGHVSSPYMGQEGPKFSAANYVLKIYQLFCDGTFLTGEAALRQDDNTHAVIERYPILLYLLPGVIYLVRSVGLKMIGLPLAIVASVGFYLTYSPTANPPYYWSYSNFHYLWWMVPWLLFFTYLSFRRAPFTLPRGLYGATLGLPLAFFLLISFKAVTVAASDSAENPLPLTTSYQNQTYTANLIVPKAPNIMDIRLEFAKPPSYPGTSVDSAPKTGVSVNGKPEHYMADYYMSQTGNTFDFSFLAHGLPLKPGDHLTLVFNNTEEPKLLQVSLRDVVFAPGRGAAILSGALVRIK